MMHPRPVLLAVLALLAPIVAGCGGSQVEADEVQVAPPTLTIPQDETASADETPDADETPTATATATADAGTGTTAAPPAAATQAPSTGATGGAGTDTGTTTTPQDTGGAQAEENFDTFCQENPGACPNP